MAVEVTCRASSLAALEGLPGSATQASSWLLLEARVPWGRDVAETELPADLRAAAEGFSGRVQLIRRPDRRDGELAVFTAESGEGSGTLWRHDAPGELGAGAPVGGMLVLVCCHGRRDPCCARLGTPVFDALCSHMESDALWQTTHVGGHRFAANLLVLPAGILLGRIEPADAANVATELRAGRIPLDHYRGRTIHPPEAQAADAAVRRALGLHGFGDVDVAGSDDGRVAIETPQGPLTAVVDVADGPPLVESCGKEPVPSVRYSVRW